MALAETARLVVDLSLKGNFARDLRKTSGALGSFEARMDHAESRAFRAGQQIGTGIKRAAGIAAVGVGLLALNVERGLESLIELEQQTAQTNAVIKSTGGIAGVTAEEVGRLSEKYESLNATIGDEVIREGENLLLTFTNIRKKAFEPTLQAALDMNTALGGGPEGLSGIVRLLGRALDNPEKGLSLLERRIGKFSAAERKAIKTALAHNDILGAQTIILDKVNEKYGGSFLAQGGTTAARVAKFHDAIEDLQRSLASGLLPVVGNIADALSDLFADPQIQSGIKSFGEDLGKLLSPQNIKTFISDVKGVAQTIAPAFKAAADAIGLVISAFSKLPPDIRNLLIGAFAVNKLTGGLVTNIAGGLAGAIGSALKTIVAGNVTVVGKNVISPGGVPGAAAGGGLKGLLKATIIGAVVVEGFSQWAQSVQGFLEQNNREADQFGLTPAEIEAKKYYTADSQTQQLILKHLGRIPTQEQWLSAQAKIPTGDANRPGKQKDDLVLPGRHYDSMKKQYNAIESVRGRISETINTISAKSDEEKAQAVSLAGTQAAILGAQTAASITNAAGIKNTTRTATSDAASRITGAIRANRPQTYVYVNVNATTVSKNVTVVNRYGPGGGSSNQNSRYGPVPT